MTNSHNWQKKRTSLRNSFTSMTCHFYWDLKESNYSLKNMMILFFLLLAYELLIFIISTQHLNCQSRTTTVRYRKSEHEQKTTTNIQSCFLEKKIVIIFFLLVRGFFSHQIISKWSYNLKMKTNINRFDTWLVSKRESVEFIDNNKISLYWMIFNWTMWSSERWMDEVGAMGENDFESRMHKERTHIQQNIHCVEWQVRIHWHMNEREVRVIKVLLSERWVSSMYTALKFIHVISLSPSYSLFRPVHSLCSFSYFM